MTDCISENEAARLHALRRCQILDTPPEEAFDRITRLAKTMLEIPMVLVSLVDKDRQWFKSRQGAKVTETPREISFCTHAIRGDQTFIVKDAQADPRFADNPLVVQDPFIRFYVGVPLQTSEGHNIGTLCAMDTIVRELKPRQLRMFEDLARLVMDELELRLLAATDGLTGLMTRRAFQEHAQLDVERCRRYHTSLSCAVIDVDNFKLINDAHGHPAGDVVLRNVAATCKACLRAADYVGRLGGDELVVMLPETVLTDAALMAERLRSAIEGTTIEILEEPISVTVSIGVAAFQPEGTLDQLLHDADMALYDAKFEGRNRVVCHLDQLKYASREKLPTPSPADPKRGVNSKQPHATARSQKLKSNRHHDAA